MAKLYFRYSAMNAGKSTMAMQVAHNYEEQGGNVLVWKSITDTKGNDTIVSRIGISRKVDQLLKPTDSPIKIVEGKKNIDAIIVDEAQFLTEEHVNELYYIAKKFNIPILCYGLRCDFKMNSFAGSARLLAIADTIEEIKNICKCKKHKATQNLRFQNGKPIFVGSQIAIDGEENTTYEAVCGECYINYYLNWQENNKK